MSAFFMERFFRGGGAFCLCLKVIGIKRKSFPQPFLFNIISSDPFLSSFFQILVNLEGLFMYDRI